MAADLATKISKFGVLAAVVCFLALFIKWLIEEKGFNVDKINDNGPLQVIDLTLDTHMAWGYNEL